MWLPIGEHAAVLGEYSERAGVVLRPFPGVGVRVTIGTPAENDRLLQVLRAASTTARRADRTACRSGRGSPIGGDRRDRRDRHVAAGAADPLERALVVGQVALERRLRLQLREIRSRRSTRRRTSSPDPAETSRAQLVSTSPISLRTSRHDCSIRSRVRSPCGARGSAGSPGAGGRSSPARESSRRRVVTDDAVDAIVHGRRRAHLRSRRRRARRGRRRARRRRARSSSVESRLAPRSAACSSRRLRPAALATSRGSAPASSRTGPHAGAQVFGLQLVLRIHTHGVSGPAVGST